MKFPAFSFLLLLSAYFLACSSPNQKEARPLNLDEVSIQELQEGYSTGQYSIRQVTEYYLQRIEEVDRGDPGLNAVLCINPDALAIADSLDKELANGTSRGPTRGLPVLLKDNIDTHDKMPTTAGSRVLKDSYPVKDSWVAMKLREAGVVILGKANLSEWANFRGELSSSGWSGVGGQTHNPYDLSRNPCGSSSGSGVAVSANLCMVAIGTETNGSIVCPSSANGIVGIKPTVGLVSREGVIPISVTQDIPGPMARTVRDAAICLGSLTGIDSLDSKTYESSGKTVKDYTVYLKENGLKDKTIGVYTKPLGRNFKVDEKIEEAVDYIKSQGARIVEIDELYDPAASEHSYNVMLFEYKEGLNRYFASLGAAAPVESIEEVIAFNESDSIELSLFNQYYLIEASKKGSLEDPEYLNALQSMLRMVREEGIDKIMDEKGLDAILAPTGGPPWKTDPVNGDAYHVGSSSPAAMAGYPNITVPMGFIDGLPVGISFFGRAWSEGVLIEIAYAYEQGTRHRTPPDLTGLGSK